MFFLIFSAIFLARAMDSIDCVFLWSRILIVERLKVVFGGSEFENSCLKD
jgi:hypothetical protein